METSLELTTRVSVDSEHKSLYSWFLQEFRPDGEKEGSALIPWEWSLYFRAKSLKRIHVVRQDRYSEIKLVQEDDFLKCELEAVAGEFRRPVSYSMFGTKREIKLFTVQVHRLPEGDIEERCEVGGNIQWVYKEEFSSVSEIVPDEVYVKIQVQSERFERFLDAISEGDDTELTLMMSGVSGFYSWWSPDIKTSFIKVLTAREDQAPKLPDGSEVSAPVLGGVSKFDVSVVRTIRATSAAIPQPEPRDEQADNEAQKPSEAAMLGLAVLARLDQLKYTLWTVVVALVLLLIFKH